MTPKEAQDILSAEVRRLRSGAGGHGGRSPAALRLAEAIDYAVVLAERQAVADRRRTVEMSERAYPPAPEPHAFVPGKFQRGAAGAQWPEETCDVCGRDPRNAVHKEPPPSPPADDKGADKEPAIYAAAFVRAFHERSTKPDDERATDAIGEAEALVAVHRRARDRP